MNPSLPHLKQKGSPSLKPACLSKTKLNPLLSFPLFLKNQKKKKKENSLTGQMGIPKPPLSDHLSLTPPHQHALPLPTQSVYTLSLFSFSSLTPLHALDAFLLLLSHLCSLYWHFFQAFPHPHNTPFLSLLIVLTIFCFHQETHTQTNNKSLSSFTTVSDHHPVLFHRSRSPLLSSPSDYGYLFHLHSHHHHHQQHKHHELSFNHHQHHCCCCFIYTINAVLSVLFSTS